MSSERAKSPTGGADFRRVMEERPLDPISMRIVVFIVESDLIRLRL